MKKINAILSNSTKEQYPVLINKLSDIIIGAAIMVSKLRKGGNN